jgi:hypothetical protein
MPAATRRRLALRALLLLRFGQQLVTEYDSADMAGPAHGSEK